MVGKLGINERKSKSKGLCCLGFRVEGLLGLEGMEL